MQVSVSTRHCDVSDELRERAQARIERLARLARRPDAGRVLFALDAGKATVELQLHTAAQVHLAAAAGTDHRTALDLALGRLRRQLMRVPKGPRPRRGVTQ
jgi:ribosomal subunit interface protein